MINRIAEQRIKCGITIEQLSEKCKISVSELSKIEKPNYKIEEMSAIKAAHIAEALDCMIKDLIYED